MSEEAPSTSKMIAARASALLDANTEPGTPLFRAFYVRDQIAYVVKPTKPFKRPAPKDEDVDDNPGLAPRKKPLYIGAVTVRRPNREDLAAGEGKRPEFSIVVHEALWALMSNTQKDAWLFDALSRIEVTETKDGALKYSVLKWSTVPWLDATVAKYGTIYEDLEDPREVALQAPPTPEELAQREAAERMAQRPDAMAVTSDLED